MMSLLTLLLYTAPAYKCAAEDSVCWMEAALNQQERAERAELRIKLLEEARKIGDKLLSDADQRGERWKKIADQIAPKSPAFWERPEFWISVGFIAGAATAVTITYAVNHPR